MIPDTWKPVHRDEDAELLGYLDGGDAGVTALTPLGHPLGDFDGEPEAESALRALGLEHLGDPWLLEMEIREEPVQVQLGELSTSHVEVTCIDYGAPELYGTRVRLEIPTEKLRPVRPLR